MKRTLTTIILSITIVATGCIQEPPTVIIEGDT
jgi:hypothetical protein